MKHIVENCIDCPFLDCYERGTCYNCTCMHPHSPKELRMENVLNAFCDKEKEGVPESCPLKWKSVTIKLEIKKPNSSIIEKLKE